MAKEEKYAPTRWKPQNSTHTHTHTHTQLKRCLAFLVSAFLFISSAFSTTLPSGYTELEYIETTGTQYIDTGVIPTLNTKVRVRFLPVAQNGIGFFGARTPASGTANRFTCTTFSLGTQLSAGMTVNEWPDFRISNYVGNLYDITIENGSTKVNGMTYTTPTNTSVDFGNNTFKLIGVKDNGDIENDTQAKYYLCQIWESGVLVHYLVPVRRNSDNVVGMYDTVTNTFFTNAGTGTFTAGSTVSHSTTVHINWGDVELASDDPSRTCTYGETFNAPSVTPTPPNGYKFLGWKPQQ